MYTIGELAQMSNITVRTLRYYGEIGLLKPSSFTEGGHRCYNEEAVEKLQNIIVLKDLGFELQTIFDILTNQVKTSSELLQMRLETIQQEQLELKKKEVSIRKTLQLMQIEGKNDWKAIFHILTNRKDNKEEIIERWKQLFSADELEVLKNLPRVGSENKLSIEWVNLLKDIREHLHIEPFSERAMVLAKRWIDLVDKMYKGDWKLAQKAWNIHLNNGNIGFYAFDPEVVKFIEKAIEHFYEKYDDTSIELNEYE